MKTMILCNHRAFARVERSRPCYATYPTPGSTRSLPIVLPRYMDLNVVPFCQSASQQPQSTNGGMVVFNVVRLFALSEAISTSPPQCQHHSTSFFIQRSPLCQSSSQYLPTNQHPEGSYLLWLYGRGRRRDGRDAAGVVGAEEAYEEQEEAKEQRRDIGASGYYLGDCGDADITMINKKIEQRATRWMTENDRTEQNKIETEREYKRLLLLALSQGV